EFVHASRTRGWLVLEAGCASFDKAKGYLPIIDVMKSYFGIEEHDEAPGVRERVSRKLSTVGDASESVRQAQWALLDALPADAPWQQFDLGQRRQAIVDATKQVLFRACQLQPVLLVFEDLHRIDAESMAVLDALVDDLPGTDMLLLGSRRPDAGPSWQTKPYCRQLTLGSLP